MAVKYEIECKPSIEKRFSKVKLILREEENTVNLVALRDKDRQVLLTFTEGGQVIVAGAEYFQTVGLERRTY